MSGPEDALINVYRAGAERRHTSGQEAPRPQLDAAILAAAQQHRAPQGHWVRKLAVAAGIAGLCLAAADSWRAHRHLEVTRRLPDPLTAAVYARADHVAHDRNRDLATALVRQFKTQVDNNPARGPSRNLTVVYSDPDELHAVSSATVADAEPQGARLRDAVAREGAVARGARVKDFQALVQELRPAVVTIVALDPQVPGRGPGAHWRAAGSGFLVTPDGKILTNAHLVNGAGRISVRMLDGQSYTATLIGADAPSDLALLNIQDLPAQNLPVLEAGDSRALQVGDWVLAIGAPPSRDTSASAGKVSAQEAHEAVRPGSPRVPVIQTDVPLNPGSSGGPLVDFSGRVVGINSQILTRDSARASDDAHEPRSYAIPIDFALSLMDQLERRDVARGSLTAQSDEAREVRAGDAASAATDQTQYAAKLNVPDELSSLSSPVPAPAAGCPQETASLRAGLQPPGSECVVLPMPNKAPAEIPTVLRWDSGHASGELGLVFRAMSGRQEMPPATGLRVERVSGAAAASGIQRGDVILAVNGAQVSDEAQLREALSRSGGHAALLIQRGDAQLFFPLQTR